jgi:hypothetical protein
MIRRYLKYSEQTAAPASADALANLFTPEERARIERLHAQFVLAPESYQLDIDFRRLAFAYWLVQHGYLSEEFNMRRSGQDAED